MYSCHVILFYTIGMKMLMTRQDHHRQIYPFPITGSGAYCNVNIMLDYAYFQLFNFDVEMAIDYAMDIVSRANTIYEESGPLLGNSNTGPFVPIVFQVQDMTIAGDDFCNSEDRWDTDVLCQMTYTDNAEQLLGRFSMTKGLSNNCLSFLFTGHNFKEVTGMALLGGAGCSKVINGGNINVGMVSMSRYRELGAHKLAKALSHEIAHTLGAVHDVEEGLLMSAWGDNSTTEFSRQAIGAIKKHLTKNLYGRLDAREPCHKRNWPFRDAPLSEPPEAFFTGPRKRSPKEIEFNPYNIVHLLLAAFVMEHILEFLTGTYYFVGKNVKKVLAYFLHV